MAEVTNRFTMVLHRLHLVQGHRVALREGEKPAQGAQRSALVVDDAPRTAGTARSRLPARRAAGARWPAGTGGGLRRSRGNGCCRRSPAPRAPPACGSTRPVARQHLARNGLDPHPADARGRAGEILLDEIIGKPHRLEDLGALVAPDGGHAHLGHDLQEALLDGGDVLLDGSLQEGALSIVCAPGGPR